MRTRIIWTCKLIITILILTYIFAHIPISSIWNAFISIELAEIFILIPIILLSTLVSAGQLKVFTDNHHMHVSLSRVLSINFSTEFYNLFLPSYLAGGAIRWHKLSRDNKKRAEALAALILNRVINTLTLALFGLICWTYDDAIISNDYYGLFFLVLFLGLLALYIFLFSQYVSSAFQHISLHPKFQLLPTLISRGLSKLIHAAMEYQKLSGREHGFIFFLSCLWQILGCTFYFLLARSLGIEISFESLGWIRSILGLLLLFPLSISGFGVREGGLIFLFGYFEIVPAAAIAFSFLLFARTLLLGFIGAFVEAKGTLAPVKQGAWS